MDVFGTGLQAGQVNRSSLKTGSHQSCDLHRQSAKHRNAIVLEGDERAVLLPVIRLGLDVICSTKRRGWDHCR